MRLVLRLAALSLAQGGQRVLLLVVAMGLATCFLVLTTSLFEGLGECIMTAGTALHAGHVNVAGIEHPTPNRTVSAIRDAEGVAAALAKEVPGVTQAVSRGISVARIVGEAGSLEVGLWGVNASQEHRLFEVLAPAGAPGTRLTPELMREPGSLLLFRREADKLQVMVGDRVTLVGRTTRGATNTADAVVAAIAEDMGSLTSSQAYVHAATLRTLIGLPEGSAQRILLYLDDPEHAEQALEVAQDRLLSRGEQLMPNLGASLAQTRAVAATQDWAGRRFAVSTWTSELSDVLWRLDAAAGISLLLFFVIAVVIGIGVANAMLVAVRLRTREIGTLRALGLSRTRILLLFVVEGLLLGAFAAALGAALGAALATGIDRLAVPVNSAAFRDIYLSGVLRLSVQPMLLVQATLSIAAVSGVACIWPAVRAARLRPIAAFRVEN